MRGLRRRTHASPAAAADAAKPGKDAFAGLPEGTSAWLAALGVTAVLAATGFIGKLALQQFLGIELENWSALDLSIFAGRWAIDTLTIVLDRLRDHPFVFVLLAAIYTAPILISYCLPAQDTRGRRAAKVSVIFAAFGLLFVLAWCEVPVLNMNDWLTRPLKRQLELPEPGLLNARAADLNVTLLVSKMDSIAKQESVCGMENNQLPDTLAKSILAKHLRAPKPAKAARLHLENLYAACVVICLAAFFALYFHQIVEEPGLADEFFRGLRLFVSWLLLPLAFCLVPYMYGKLIYSTEYPNVTVTFASGEASRIMILMDKTDKDFSLLSIDSISSPDSIPYYVQIRHRDEIKTIQQYGKLDVLNTMLIQCKWLPGYRSDDESGNP